MKVRHVFGGHVYLISNFGVARNPIFKDKKDLDFFKKKFAEYLGDICDVYANSHQLNQFQYLVKIKDREELESFYIKKMKEKKKNVGHDLYGDGEIPDSYLIFSQEVSNLLNSVAKKFNFRHGRKGSLFGERYTKILVESEKEMGEWKERMENLEGLVDFAEEWSAQELRDAEIRALESSEITESSEENHDLRGCFLCLPRMFRKVCLY